MSQYAHLSEPDPEFTEQFERLPPRPQNVELRLQREMYANNIVQRNDSVYGSRLPPLSAYRVEDHQVAVEGGEVTVRCVIPTFADGEIAFPLLYWMHGGGWRMGDINMDDYLLRIIAVERRVVIASVDYRLAPDYKWPTGLDDAYAGLKWAVQRASSLSASVQKGLVIGGMSAGANLAAVIAHRAQDDPALAGSPLIGQILTIPLVIHPDAYPEEYKPELLSFEQNRNAAIVSAEALRRAYRDYCINPTEPEISPLLYASHKGLPPTYIQVCGGDPLRDEGILYEQVLRKDGVRTKIDIYPGVPHGFYSFCPRAKQAIKFEQDLREALTWLLSGVP